MKTVVCLVLCLEIFLGVVAQNYQHTGTVRFYGATNAITTAVSGPNAQYGYFSDTTGMVYKVDLGSLVIAGSLKLGDVYPFFVFQFGDAIYYGTNTSALYKVDTIFFTVEEKVDLSSAIPPNWMGGYALDTASSFCYLTGKNAMAQLSLQNITHPPKMIAIPQAEPLGATFVAPDNLFISASDSRTKGDGYVIRVNTTSFKMMDSLKLPNEFWSFIVTGTNVSTLIDVFTSNFATQIDTSGGNLVPSKTLNVSKGGQLSELACFSSDLTTSFVLYNDQWQQWNLSDLSVQGTFAGINNTAPHACFIDPRLPVAFLTFVDNNIPAVARVSF